jgi:mono/diheme cytochrome c family protein
MTAARTVLCALPLAAGLCAWASPAACQTAASLARGQEITERACAGCHALGGDRSVEGTPAPSFRSIAARPNQPPQRLASFIMTPHRPMPGLNLSLADVNDVVAYILSLK